MNQSQLESTAWHAAHWSARNCHALVVNVMDAGLLDQITFFTLNSVSKLYSSLLHFLNYLLLKEQYKSSLGNNLALSVPNTSSAFRLFSSQNLHAHKKNTKRANRPFQSSPQPLFQSEAKCEVCCENQFSFILKLELIIITKVSHLDSLWKRDWGELGNGLFAVHCPTKT